MKEVFVFGAGASHASGGTPLGLGLVWEYFPDCFEFDTRSNKIKFEPLLKFFKSKPKWKDYAVELERGIRTGTLLGFDVPKKYYVDELMKDLQKDGDSESIKLIKRLTVEHIAETASWPTTQGLSLHEEFAQKLEGRPSSEVSIISFNFDCLLHEEFKKTNLYKPVCFDYLLSFKEIPENRKFYKDNRGKGIPLIKPNGSLDWAYNLKTKEIKLLHWLIKSGTYYSGDDQFEPYIFLPHQQKDELMQPLWDRAKKELSIAGEITIIGYSFPAYDKEVIKLFQNNIKSNVVLTVVDLASESKSQTENESKYRKLFQKIQDIRFNFNGFQDWINNFDSRPTGPLKQRLT